MQRVHKFQHFSFDVACMQCMQCGHPHSHQQVPFACVALGVASRVLCGLDQKLGSFTDRIKTLQLTPCIKIASTWLPITVFPLPIPHFLNFEPGFGQICICEFPVLLDYPASVTCRMCSDPRFPHCTHVFPVLLHVPTPARCKRCSGPEI